MSRKTRKLMWSVPLVAVLAVAGALALFVALAPNQAQADGVPGAVTGLTGAADGRSIVNLTWTAPSIGTATGYRIDRSVDARVWEALKADTGSTATSYQDTGLKASTIYNYRGLRSQRRTHRPGFNRAHLRYCDHRYCCEAGTGHGADGDPGPRQEDYPELEPAR